MMRAAIDGRDETMKRAAIDGCDETREGQPKMAATKRGKGSQRWPRRNKKSTPPFGEGWIMMGKGIT